MIVLCLLAAGGASAFGQTVQSMGTTQDNAAIYNLYYSYYNNGYGGKWMESYYATIKKVTPIIGFATIPETITYGDHTYTVRGFGTSSTVSSDVQNVGSLTFKGDVTSWDSPVNFWSGMTGFTDLVFEGSSYPFDGDYTKYFKNSVAWVDVYLADKTVSQIAELKRYAPWNQFHSVNYRPVKQTLTLNLTFSPVDINANVALYSLGDYETFSDADYNLDYLTPVDMSSTGQFEVTKFQRYLVVADYNHNKVEPHVIVNGLEYPMTPHYNIAFCQIKVQGDVVLDVSFPSIATWEGKLKNQTYGMVFVTELGDNTSFADNGMQNVIPYMYSTTNGQTSNGLFAGCNYSTVYVNNDPTKTPHLKRNDVEVTLKNIVRGTVSYAYYDELNVQQNITYEWYVVPVETTENDPVVTVIRTGEGDVTLTGMWDWDSQNDTWYNTSEVNCTGPTTVFTIPRPTMSTDSDGEYWGFEVNVRPRPGGTVRSFMLGHYAYDPDTETSQLTMEEDVSMTQNADGSYSFIVDARDYMNWSIGNYVVFVDLDNGASDTNTQTFARYGGTGSVSLNYEENCDDYDPDIEIGTTTITLPDYNSDDCTYACLYVDKVPGEKFTAYRDGVDVTDDFIPVNYNNQYAYSFDKNTEHYRQSSVWTLIFEQTNDIIEFADAKVKAICVENWDTNEDGELSYEEAAAVTDIGEVFKGNTEITSFDEFQHFTGVTRIGKDAFRGDTELTSIVLPQSVVQIYGGWAFYGCSSLEHVVLPDNIGIVDTATFGQTNISSINFPETANLILGYGVITHAPLKSLFIPANVVTINDYVIYNCPNLACISVDEGNTIFDSREGCNAIIKTSTNTLIASCKNSVIPESVTALGNYAFFKTDGLTKLELPAGLSSIGKSGIRDCSSLTTIVAHMPEPFAINTSGSSNDYNISDLPANCKLVVPAGKRQAYIDAGWTETIFRGGVVEAEGSGILGDVNGDGQVTIADVTALVNIILGR